MFFVHCSKNKGKNATRRCCSAQNNKSEGCYHGETMKKPRILITRATFPEVVQQLEQHFDVHHNQADQAWSAQELQQYAHTCDGILSVPSDAINAALLQACPRLRICANNAVGYNNFDLAAMAEHQVLGTNTPDVLSETTADFGFALLMATARRITEAEHYLRSGQWQRWTYDMLIGQDIFGSTLGIWGMGRIGQAIARRGAHGFGMRVLYHNRSRLAPSVEQACKAQYVDSQTLLQQADHLVLVLPLTPESHHTIGLPQLQQMKKTATLVNIARGGIVDDAALAQALRTGLIAGAGLDVFEDEPKVHPDLLTLPNVVLTPHIGSASARTRLAMAQLAANNLIAFFEKGQALTPVNPEVLEAR